MSSFKIHCTMRSLHHTNVACRTKLHLNNLNTSPIHFTWIWIWNTFRRSCSRRLPFRFHAACPCHSRGRCGIELLAQLPFVPRCSVTLHACPFRRAWLPKRRAGIVTYSGQRPFRIQRKPISSPVFSYRVIRPAGSQCAASLKQCPVAEWSHPR